LKPIEAPKKLFRITLNGKEVKISQKLVQQFFWEEIQSINLENLKAFKDLKKRSNARPPIRTLPL
jgi:hypothetical protein